MACLSRNLLVQGAKEELEILEFLHPNKFESIKMDLKAFISQLEEQEEEEEESQHMPPLSPSTCHAATQESSSINKIKRSCPAPAPAPLVLEAKRKRRFSSTDAVLHRAQLCLHKIQHLKTTFL